MAGGRNGADRRYAPAAQLSSSSVAITRAYGILTPRYKILSLALSILGRRGWLRVLRKEAFGDAIFCTKLLRRVRQCWCNDERGRNPTMFLPGAFIYIWHMSSRLNGVLLLSVYVDPETS